MQQPMMTANDVAEILRFSVRSILDTRFRRRIGLKSVKIGHSLRFRPDDVALILQTDTQPDTGLQVSSEGAA